MCGFSRIDKDRKAIHYYTEKKDIVLTALPNSSLIENNLVYSITI